MENNWGVPNYGANLKVVYTAEGIDLSKPLFVDVETNELDSFVGIGYTQDGINIYYCTDLCTVSRLIANYLNTGGKGLVGHNLKFDAKLLCKWGVGVHPEHIKDDTILMSYVMNTTKDSHALKALGKELGYEWPEYKDIVGKGKNKKTLDKQPVELVANYCAMDVLVTYKLWEHFNRKMDIAQRSYYTNIELPLMRVLFEMELKGVKINVEQCAKLDKRLRQHLDDATNDLSRLGGISGETKLNPNSNKQIAAILQSRGLSLPTTPKGNKKVDKWTLDRYKGDEFVKVLMQYNKLEKLWSTYTQGLLSRNSDTIYTTYNQISKDKGISTGRLSSSNPNLQQIPARTEEGKLIRELFIPSEGHSLIAIDYSQIEYRVLAHFTQEPVLLEAFKNGKDVHEETGKILGCSRDVGKTLNFACVSTDTLVLSSDLTWKEIGCMNVGDKILTCEENGREGKGRGRARRWVEATITHHEIDYEDCLDIELDNGDTISCTKDHPLLVNNHKKLKGKWVKAEDLKVGWFIPKYLNTWEDETSYEAGWLAGMMDGEGYVCSTGIGVAQKPGDTFDRIVESCKKFCRTVKIRHGLTEYKGGSSPCNSSVINGGLHVVFNVLGRLKPKRLITNFLRKILGKTTISAIEFPRIVSIEPSHKNLIVRISTSASTYMTAGYFSHNSIYGAGASKIARTAECTQEEAQKFLDAYWKRLPHVTAWVNRTKYEAAMRRGVYTLLKRFIPLPDINHPDLGERMHWERVAVNTVIQGSAAEILKMAMIQIRKKGYLPLLTVHDELLFEVGDDEVWDNEVNIENTRSNIKTTMENIVQLSVPLVADVGVGKNWREAKDD